MELKKAIEILKEKKDQYQREVTFVPEQNGKKYMAEMDWFDTLLKVLDMPEEEVVFYGTRSAGKTVRRSYEMGLIVGTKREREHWEKKIKDKIETLEKQEKTELEPKDVLVLPNDTTYLAVRAEYYTMVGLVVGNIPLLYVLNKDWFHTLIYETPGKIVLGICGIVIVVTYFFLMKFTKPVEYKA